jgi:hypothetical protein
MDAVRTDGRRAGRREEEEEEHTGRPVSVHCGCVNAGLPIDGKCLVLGACLIYRSTWLVHMK